MHEELNKMVTEGETPLNNYDLSTYDVKTTFFNNEELSKVGGGGGSVNTASAIPNKSATSPVPRHGAATQQLPSQDLAAR